MNTFFVLGWLLVMFTTTPVQQKTKLQNLQWLAGNWQIQTKNGVLVESWEMLNDSSFTGQSFLLKADGSKQILENIELVYRLNEVFYIPTVEDQNNHQPVKFKLTVYNEKAFTAVNNGHDYPKRIRYTLQGTDSIHASIDDGNEKPIKFSNFYFTRKK